MGNRNPKVSYSIRIIAGLYLIYLGISAARTAITDGTTMNSTLAVALGILLAVCGAVIAVTGGLKYRYMKKHPEKFGLEEEVREDTEEPETDDVEEKPAQTSVFQKASIPEHLQVTDEEENSDSEEEETEA